MTFYDVPLTQDNVGPLHVLSDAADALHQGAFVEHVHRYLAWSWPILRHAAVADIDWRRTVEIEDDTSAVRACVDPTAQLALAQGERNYQQDLTPEAVSRAIGHAKIWAELVGHRDWAYQCIIEEGARWCGAVPISLSAMFDAVNALPKDWDICLLGGRAIETYSATAQYAHVRFVDATPAYIVRKEAAWRLLTQIYPIQEPLEYHVSRKAIQTGLRVYMLTPPCFADEAIPEAKPRGDAHALGHQPLGYTSPRLDVLRFPG